jgi:hypothetical protein
LRGGDGIELFRFDTRFAKRALRDGHQVPQMFAGGQFRHDAAVFRVQLDLRGNGAGQNPAVPHDRGAGFIAGSFKGQESHALNRLMIESLNRYNNLTVQRFNELYFAAILSGVCGFGPTLSAL